MKSKNRCAFFDIDGTLARQSLMINHFKQLVRFELIDERVYQQQIRDVYELYEKRYDDYDNYLNILAQVYREELRKIDPQFNGFISKQVVDKYGEIVYRYTRNRIRYHQKQGHMIFFISGSPDFLVKEMAEKYKITAYRATIYPTKDNHYTGEVIPMWDSNSKDRALNELIQKYDIDLKKSYAYGDTTGDLSMLQRVGNKIAINPTKEMVLEIRKNKSQYESIKIVVERKDIIYHLTPDVEIEC
ncbi:MAG: HAD-IB family hydrolase [Tissierellia bacterium]|nr:HAD-IB family hydrolase [Tissierellia bacterium]